MPETLPWASGNRKPPPGGVPKRKRRFRVKSRKQGLIAAVWMVVTLAALAVALVTQLTLMIVVTVLSGLITAAATLSAMGEPDPVPARAAPARRSANPRGNTESGRSRQRPGTAVPNCTRNKGVSIDDCTCAAKHVRSAAGARRYKLGVGDPIDKIRKPRAATKPKAAKEPKVPSTNNARPIRPPVGEVMGRVS